MTKKELESKSKPRKIEIKAMEESRKEKFRRSSEAQQKDFRHLLKRAGDQPRGKRGSRTKGGEQRRSREDGDKQPHKPSHHQLRSPERKKGQATSVQGAAELTGSWDYIPSPPSSTVDLLASAEEEGGQRREVRAYGYSEDERDGEYQNSIDVDTVASSPLFDLPKATNSVSGSDTRTTTTSSEHKTNQDFDFETQF